MNVVVTHLWWSDRGYQTVVVTQYPSYHIIFFTDTVSATQNLKNVRTYTLHHAQLPMIVERMASVHLTGRGKWIWNIIPSNPAVLKLFVIYYADYEAERLFSHVIQVFILIYFYRYCMCKPKECHDKELCKTDNDCGEDGKCKWKMSVPMMARKGNLQK